MPRADRSEQVQEREPVRDPVIFGLPSFIVIIELTVDERGRTHSNLTLPAVSGTEPCPAS
jgi:hypothetical protein